MDKHRAHGIAKKHLELILQSHPDLMKTRVQQAADGGAEAATFCIKFMETYAAWLEKQDPFGDSN